MKITLEKGTIVVLDLDNSLVYVEDVQPIYAAVVACPEQPYRRKDEKTIFVFGAVKARRISPYSTAIRTIAVTDLSEVNRDFIGTFESLRTTKNPNYVYKTAAQEAEEMTVTKAGPAKRERAPRESTGKGKRALARAAKKAAALAEANTADAEGQADDELAEAPVKKTPRYKTKCATCGEQPGHFNHPKDHAFVPPAETAPVKASAVATSPMVERAKKATAPKGATYTLVSDDLTKAQATKKGDKYKDGNRCHRVVCALALLPSSTGTIDDVVQGVMTDGNRPMANAEKVVKRTLNQCTTPEFGNIVKRNA